MGNKRFSRKEKQPLQDTLAPIDCLQPASTPAAPVSERPQGSSSHRPVAPLFDFAPREFRISSSPPRSGPSSHRPVAPLFDFSPRPTQSVFEKGDSSLTTPKIPPASAVSDSLGPLTSGPSSIPDKACSVEDEDATHRAFFDSAEEAIARVHAEELRMAVLLRVPDEEEHRVVSREVMERRTRLRRLVTGVVGIASVMSLLVGIRLVSASKRLSDTTTASPLPAAVFPVPAAASNPAVSAALHSESDSYAESDSEQIPNRDQETDARPDPIKAKTLSHKALQLLEKGDYQAAIGHASASVEADSSDATPYLYWGTALIELGKKKEAKEVFSRCVEQATRGSKQECNQFK